MVAKVSVIKFYKNSFFRSSIALLLLILTHSCAPIIIRSGHVDHDLHRLKMNIVDIDVAVATDTISYKELRFKKIRSALDTQFLMNRLYGDSDQIYVGFYQNNVNREVWNKVKLFNDYREFKVIASGTETGEDYFSCISVFDENNMDCLQDSHPDQIAILKLFAKEIRN